MKRLLRFLIFLALLVALGYFFIPKLATKYVTKTVVTNLEEQISEKLKDTNIKLSDEEVKTITDILGNHTNDVNAENITKVKELIENQDIEGLTNYAQNILTEDEKEQLKDIARQHGIEDVSKFFTVKE